MRAARHAREGDYQVEYGATLRAEDVVVIGNVQAENAKNVRVLEGSRVGGSVQVKQGGAATVSDSRVEGDIQYDSNSAMLRVLRDRVGGSVQAFQNVGGVEIRRNTIDGNLQCKENSPAPITAEEGIVTDTLTTATIPRVSMFGVPNVFVDPRRAMVGVRIDLGRP